MVSKLVALLLLVVLCKGFVINNLKLKQVFILSRHNIRYPLGETLHTYSPKPWPQPAGVPGELTPKGALLEGYMGEYISEWLKKEQFLPEGCPNEDTVYVYANTLGRTKATARAFVDSAFKSCNVTVNHLNSTGEDPLFYPAVHNTTEAYKEMVFKEIIRKTQNNHKLNAAFLELNKILNIKESDVCKKDGICDLTGAYNTITYKVGKEVWVEGPLFIGISSMDSFTMAYYDGSPIQDIAWGQITTPEKWRLLTEIPRQDHYIRYTTLAEDIAKPLVNYLTKTFKNYDTMPKLMLLVGHDYNMNALATALGFQSWDDLPNQNEKYPIGGKYVFQRWTDGENDFLKVEYVYPSWSQLRDGAKYSLDSPPERVVMRLNWCSTDRQGFCPWTEFIKKL